MKRVTIAWLLLLGAIFLAGAGSFVVHRSFGWMDDQLTSAQADCIEQQYDSALQKSKHAEEFFAQNEHLLALFLRRDYLREIQTTLSGLSSYACEEYSNDFLCESSQAIQQLNAVKHLFFGII